MSEVVIGIDSSTTATKAIAWNADGGMVAEGRADIPMNSPQPNYYEQDPQDWWQSTCKALRQVTSAVDPASISSVAISNQRETIGAFRRNGDASHPAMVWLDERSRATFEQLAASLGNDPDGTPVIHRISGKPVDVVPAVTRVHWMSQRDPQSHAATEVYSDVHGYLAFRLTGEWKTSWVSADPTGMFGMERKCWSPEIMAAAGVDKTRLPEAFKPGTVLGKVSAAAAESTGLAAGTPVVAGGGDGQMAGLGCAALDPKTAYMNVGTALVSGILGQTYLNSPAWRTMGGPVGQGYYYESCIKGGTFTVNWFLNTICAGDPTPAAQILETMEKECSAISIGANGLVMLPYWQGVMGPYWDSSARGAFIGLSGVHTRAHLFRALMEGLALETHLCTQAVENALGQSVDRFVAIGGGAASAVWRQIFADATGKTVARSETVEASSLGAAMCAAVGAGWFPTIDEAAKAMAGEIIAVATPRSDAHAKYAELFETYRQVYERLKPLYAGLDRLAGQSA